MAASSPRNPGRSTPSRRSVSAGTPSSGSTRADRMCSASRIGLSSLCASAWASRIASWAFCVNRSSCMIDVLACVFVVDEIEERSGGSLRRVREVGRQDDLGPDEQVAMSAALESGHALAAEPERSPGLRALGDRQDDAPLEGLDRDVRTEQNLLESQ